MIILFWIYVLVIVAFYAFLLGRVSQRSSTSSSLSDTLPEGGQSEESPVPGSGD
jgi:hypothetical protein